MESEVLMLFHPFGLDPRNEQLWRGEQCISQSVVAITCLLWTIKQGLAR